MGSFPDARLGRWRWAAFLRCTSGHGTAAKGGSGKSQNPCVGVAGPAAHAIFHGGDAAAAWGARGGVAVIDAYSPVRSSPSSDEAFPDGLHPKPSSDESLAVNQLAMNWACTAPARVSPPA